jgi:tetratricopeptide (TPR) repeat protein
MKPPKLIASGSLDRILQAADAAWDRRDFQECIETLQRVSNLAPSNTEILLRLGHVHGLRYDYVAAERCFEQALRIAPRKMEMLTIIAEHCRSFRNPKLQENYLLLAVQRPDVTPLACLKLAELYERLRRLPQAGQWVERALHLNPAYPAALLLKAKLWRQAGQLETAEQLLRSFITKPIPLVWTHAQAWYELATLLDRQERYGEAMTAVLQAKSLLSMAAEKEFGKVRISTEEFKQMEPNLSAGMFQRWRDNAPMVAPRRRLVLIGGYPRSGTTLLEQVLDAHPDMVSVEETEIFYNDALPPVKHQHPASMHILEMLEKAGNTALQLARTNYFRSVELYVGQPVGNRLLIDKNPALTAHIPAFLRIFPEARFLIALRDPRDVVLSRFMLAQPVVPLTTPFLSLEGTVTDYVNTMGLWRTIAPLMPGTHIEVRYEDMVEDLESIVHKTLDFLGLPWEARVLNFDEHARKKMVFSPNYADVAQPVYKRAVGRWRNYQKYLEPHLEKLEPFVKAFGYE